MTPLQAANEYHKEKNVQEPNSDYSWYVIAVNDYLKRAKLYTQEQLNKEKSKSYSVGYEDANDEFNELNAGEDL